jgi:hypothetical protein
MGTNTQNYGMFKPDEIDPMSDVKKNITDNLRILEARPEVPVIAAGAALPQSGNYNLYDRVFRNDAATGTTYPSNYMLVCKDTVWGWYWRPIQQYMSPWVNLPATIIADSNYEIHPTHPVAISFDSRGWLHWRGALRKKTANIPTGTNISILQNIPVGLRPHLRQLKLLPVTPVVSGTTETGYAGGRIYLQETGITNFRFWNTANATSQIFWLNGLKYQPCKELFYGP